MRPGHVEQREAVDLPVGAAQAARQLLQQRPGDRGIGLDAAAEVVAAQHEEVRVLHRDHVRRARLLVDQRELAEMLADPEHAEDDFAAVFADEHDLHAARHGRRTGSRPGSSSKRMTLPFGIALLARQLGEALQLGVVELGEERNGRAGSWRSPSVVMLRERTRRRRPNGRRVASRVRCDGRRERRRVTNQCAAASRREHTCWRTSVSTSGARRAKSMSACLLRATRVYFPAIVPKLLRCTNENRYPSRVRDRDREVRLRQHVPDALDDRRDPYRHLLAATRSSPASRS